MSAQSNTNPARGMRDFLPVDVRRREYVIKIIKEVYESYGFEPLETPAVENLETLTGKYGEEGNQLIYKILKRGEKLNRDDKELSDLALRYDLTVPLARVVANHKNELPKFFKRYQIQPVWRADRPARGRYREFYQCDVDAIGSSSMIVEAELISAVSEILERLGFDDFVIRVNHREVLTAMLRVADVADDKHIEALTALDKLDKIGYEKVLDEMIGRGIEKQSAEKLVGWFRETEEDKKDYKPNGEHIKGGKKWNEYILTKMFHSRFGDSTKDGYQDNLNMLLKYTDKETRIQIDPSLARGLSYYTGAIFEVNVPDLAGSLAGGGRYDGLIGMFGKDEIPACGFSLGLERILVVMEERGMFPKELSDSSADVLVTVWDENSIGESLKLANELRKENLRVLVYPEADKLGKQFKYADSIGIKTAIILRDEEIAENKVKVKNLQTGDEETFSREEIAAKIVAVKNAAGQKN